MTTLRPAPISTRQLTMIERGLWTAEISSTHGFGRVYDDACDEGLTVVSATSGQERVFVVAEEHRDAEGELTHWTLVPADARQNARIVVFND